MMKFITASTALLAVLFQVSYHSTAVVANDAVDVVPKKFERSDNYKVNNIDEDHVMAINEEARALGGGRGSGRADSSYSVRSDSQDTCGEKCSSDSDCDDDCPKCHKKKNHWGKHPKYGTCVEDSSSVRSRNDDTCGDKCSSNRDCDGDCPTCNKQKDKWGSEYKYGKCVEDDDASGRSDENGNGFCGVKCSSDRDCDDDCDTCHKQKDNYGTTYKYGKCVEGGKDSVQSQSRASENSNKWSKWESTKESVKSAVKTCGIKCTSSDDCIEGDDGCNVCHKKHKKWGKQPKYGTCVDEDDN